MNRHEDHRVAMLADILLEWISDPYMEASDISDTVMDELRDLQEYHAKLAEKTAKVISFLGG
jgi:hypothetical protein